MSNHKELHICQKSCSQTTMLQTPFLDWVSCLHQ